MQHHQHTPVLIALGLATLFASAGCGVVDTGPMPILSDARGVIYLPIDRGLSAQSWTAAQVAQAGAEQAAKVALAN